MCGVGGGVIGVLVYPGGCSYVWWRFVVVLRRFGLVWLRFVVVGPTAEYSVSLNTPGHPRTPQDTPRRPNMHY